MWPPRPDRVIVRVSNAPRAEIDLPLQPTVPYDLVLRLDPVVPGLQQQISVLFNGQFVARPDLTVDPLRMGAYRFRVQPHQVRSGRNRLAIVPDLLVPASSAGDRFAWLPPHQRIGIRLWYVRILPNPNP